MFFFFLVIFFYLTEDKIKSFLNEMKSSKQELVGGMGGDFNAANIYIYYNVDGILHIANFENISWYFGKTTDGNIYKIVDNNMPQNSDYDILRVADKTSNVISDIINRLNNQ